MMTITEIIYACLLGALGVIGALIKMQVSIKIIAGNI